MAHVAIVGAGVMGTALAWPLSDNGHRISLVGTPLDRNIIEEARSRYRHPKLGRELPPEVTAYYSEELGTAIEDADLIVSGVNSWGVDWIADVLAESLQRGRDVIGVTKGFRADQSGAIEVFPRVIAGRVPESIRKKSNFMAVGGPCIAGELAGRRQSCVVFAAEEKEAAERVARLFRTDYYHVWPSADLWGLELAVALKNAYVLGVGMANGMLEAAGGADEAGALMHNPAAATFAQALYEMEQILTALDGTPAHAHGLPGAGDQYVTAMGGRTLRLGTFIGRGYRYGEAREMMAGETLETVAIIDAMSRVYPRLQRQGLLRDRELPLMETLIAAITKDEVVSLPWGRYFASL